MKRIIVAVALFAFTPTAEAQPNGVWAHHYEEAGYTAYLDIQDSRLFLWAVPDRGDWCRFYPQRVRWDGDTLVHPRGTRWTVTVEGDRLEVALPDTTVTYHRAETHPRHHCPTADT
jgi:hypothetical protein